MAYYPVVVNSTLFCLCRPKPLLEPTDSWVQEKPGVLWKLRVRGAAGGPLPGLGWHWRLASDKSWGRIQRHPILQRAWSIAVEGLLGGKLKITLIPLYVHECMCVHVCVHPIRDQGEYEDLGWVLLVLEVGECYGDWNRKSSLLVPSYCYTAKSQP